MCQICQKEGHLKIVCPEENLPAIKPLPPLTPDYANLLEHVLWRVPGNSATQRTCAAEPKVQGPNSL